MSGSQSSDCRQPGNSLLPGCGPAVPAALVQSSLSPGGDVIRECSVLGPGFLESAREQWENGNNMHAFSYVAMKAFKKGKFYQEQEKRKEYI